MPPKVLNDAAKKGQTSLFSFFRKPEVPVSTPAVESAKACTGGDDAGKDTENEKVEQNCFAFNKV
jgi:hypothetical protein